MSNNASAAALSFWAVTGIILVGCGVESKPHLSPVSATTAVSPAPASSDHETEVVQPLDNSETVPKSYVPCKATLAAYKDDYPWFEDFEGFHVDGVAPLASFVLSEPATYPDRKIDILFKFKELDSTIASPNKEDIGRSYSFQLPEDFFEGNFNTIDNSSVRNLRIIESEHENN